MKRASLCAMGFFTALCFLAWGQPPEDFGCGKIGGEWSCNDWESNGNCPFAGTCNEEGYCSIWETHSSKPTPAFHHAEFPVGIPFNQLRKLKVVPIYCGEKYYCFPYCVEVNGVDKCANLLFIPLGGFDMKDDGPCPAENQ